MRRTSRTPAPSRRELFLGLAFLTVLGGVVMMRGTGTQLSHAGFTMQNSVSTPALAVKPTTPGPAREATTALQLDPSQQMQIAVQPIDDAAENEPLVAKDDRR